MRMLHGYFKSRTAQYFTPVNSSPCPPPLTILMTERGGAITFCRILAPPMTPPPPPQTPQYFTMLMTEREGAPLSFCRILAPPNAPPHDSKIYYYLLMTEMRDAIIFVGFWRPPMPSPPPLTPQYLTILMIERGGRHHLL